MHLQYKYLFTILKTQNLLEKILTIVSTTVLVSRDFSGMEW